MPTTDHGLVYPDSSGNNQLWTHIQNLAESTETALDVYETWNSWTPSWDTTSGGGFTSVGGSGVNQGFYIRVGKFVHAEFRVEIASGFATDSGTFIIYLPINAYLWGGATLAATVGQWTARDTSATNHWSGSMTLWDATASSAAFSGSWDGTAPRKRVDSNDPVVWANGDVISGVLNYRGV